jgi:hypothetical protein
MPFHYHFTDSQTQTAAAGITLLRSTDLLEFAKKLLPVFFRNLYAAIGNSYCYKAIANCSRKSDYCVFRRELDRIGEEAGKDLPKTVVIAIDLWQI